MTYDQVTKAGLRFYLNESNGRRVFQDSFEDRIELALMLYQDNSWFIKDIIEEVGVSLAPVLTLAEKRNIPLRKGRFRKDILPLPKSKVSFAGEFEDTEYRQPKDDEQREETSSSVASIPKTYAHAGLKTQFHGMTRQEISAEMRRRSLMNKNLNGPRTKKKTPEESNQIAEKMAERSDKLFEKVEKLSETWANAVHEDRKEEALAFAKEIFMVLLNAGRRDLAPMAHESASAAKILYDAF